MCSKIKLLGKEGRKEELLNGGQEYKYDLEVPPKNVYIYQKKSNKNSAVADERGSIKGQKAWKKTGLF